MDAYEPLRTVNIHNYFFIFVCNCKCFPSVEAHHEQLRFNRGRCSGHVEFPPASRELSGALWKSPDQQGVFTDPCNVPLPNIGLRLIREI